MDVICAPTEINATRLHLGICACVCVCVCVLVGYVCVFLLISSTVTSCAEGLTINPRDYGDRGKVSFFADLQIIVIKLEPPDADKIDSSPLVPRDDGFSSTQREKVLFPYPSTMAIIDGYVDLKR